MPPAIILVMNLRKRRWPKLTTIDNLINTGAFLPAQLAPAPLTAAREGLLLVTVGGLIHLSGEQ